MPYVVAVAAVESDRVSPECRPRAWHRLARHGGWRRARHPKQLPRRHETQGDWRDKGGGGTWLTVTVSGYTKEIVNCTWCLVVCHWFLVLLSDIEMNRLSGRCLYPPYVSSNPYYILTHKQGHLMWFIHQTNYDNHRPLIYCCMVYLLWWVGCMMDSSRSVQRWWADWWWAAASSKTQYCCLAEAGELISIRINVGVYSWTLSWTLGKHNAVKIQCN